MMSFGFSPTEEIKGFHVSWKGHVYGFCCEVDKQDILLIIFQGRLTFSLAALIEGGLERKTVTEDGKRCYLSAGYFRRVFRLFV